MSCSLVLFRDLSLAETTTPGAQPISGYVVMILSVPVDDRVVACTI
jgi:hypothetical protein